MGDAERMDVTLNYAIKDYTGKIYLTKSETLLVDKKINLDRNFETGMLPVGDYIISLELIYQGGVAPSSAHFIVTKKGFENTFAYIIFLLLAGIFIISIFIIILLLRKHRGQSQ